MIRPDKKYITDRYNRAISIDKITNIKEMNEFLKLYKRRFINDALTVKELYKAKEKILEHRYEGKVIDDPKDLDAPTTKDHLNERLLQWLNIDTLSLSKTQTKELRVLRLENKSLKVKSKTAGLLSSSEETGIRMRKDIKQVKDESNRIKGILHLALNHLSAGAEHSLIEAILKQAVEKDD